MNYTQLTSEQRYTINVLLRLKEQKNKIAKAVEVSNSTITRELQRNSGKRGYSWRMAETMARERKERLPGNRATPQAVMQEVVRLLKTEQWSPKQISGYLKKEKGIEVSHATIYNYIHADKENGGELYKNCRHRLKYRHHKKKKKRPTKIRNIPDRVSIHERPSEADGSRFGDWEMDLIIGKKRKDAILTLCERSTNYMIMQKLVHGKLADNVADTVIALLLPYKKFVKTITTDNGSEFVRHKRIAQRLDTTVYFADSYSSWQKGAIENTNKLIRQYIPKNSDFSLLSDSFIRSVQFKINRRPREKLNFNNPKSLFFQNLL